MFRTFSRRFLPNPLDRALKQCAKRGGKKILLAWNRGLGDIALGLYAMVQRIRTFIPQAEITFLTRETLREGFSLLEGVTTLIAKDWQRGKPFCLKTALHQLQIDPKTFDLIFEKPSPTDWVHWQRGRIVPRLKWDLAHENLWKKFNLPPQFIYIGAQPVTETTYGLWRNWPVEEWEELFTRLQPFDSVRILLFGYEQKPLFSHPNVIDLRGKTNLFDFLSLLKNFCQSAIFPDSGLLSMAYYLDTPFPIQLVSLWGDPNHGILKQAVASPNPKLIHHPLIATERNLKNISATQVLNQITHVKPLYMCPHVSDVSVAISAQSQNVGAIVLAGGQGSRLGITRPKGTYSVQGKSLFQWICERAPQKDFPIAVMTSPQNHAETISFFAAQNHFGREVYFFPQEELPFLDENLQPLPFLAPIGNGNMFKAFIQSGLGDLFQSRGIDSLLTVPVDNVLADPADQRLIEFHRREQNEITLKCIPRERPDETMGLIIERWIENSRQGQENTEEHESKRLEVLEYFECKHKTPSLATERLNHPQTYSYAGMMAISLPFLFRMAALPLPLRFVKKTPPEQKKWAWKREMFIFDALLYASRAKALSYPRKTCYAPIKDSFSLPRVERLLQDKEPGR